MTVIDSHTPVGQDTLGTDQGLRLSEAGARDFWALLKPRVMSLVIFTAFAGLILAPGHINRSWPWSRFSVLPSALALPARSTCGTTPISMR